MENNNTDVMDEMSQVPGASHIERLREVVFILILRKLENLDMPKSCISGRGRNKGGHQLGQSWHWKEKVRKRGFTKGIFKDKTKKSSLGPCHGWCGSVD